MRPKLCDLYENDCIFDKFECSISGDGQNFITGSYNNLFHLYDKSGQTDVCIEATNGNKGRRHSMPTTAAKGAPAVMGRKMDVETMNFTQKVLQTAWHPEEEEVAVAAGNHLFLYKKN